MFYDYINLKKWYCVEPIETQVHYYHNCFHWIHLFACVFIVFGPFDHSCLLNVEITQSAAAPFFSLFLFFYLFFPFSVSLPSFYSFHMIYSHTIQFTFVEMNKMYSWMEFLIMEWINAVAMLIDCILRCSSNSNNWLFVCARFIEWNRAHSTFTMSIDNRMMCRWMFAVHCAQSMRRKGLSNEHTQREKKTTNKM